MGASRRAVPSLVLAAARAGSKRLRPVWFNLVQTAVAAGLSWYLAHDVLEHPQPFFAPIAAAVSLSTSNVLRAQRAIQMMIGVTLGIGVGSLAQALLGAGDVPIAVAALVALGAAVFIGGGFIGHGMMFANQTVVSAILVLALYRGGVGLERIFDALIGGAVAIVFAVLLFPADPLKVLGNARVGVLGVLHDVLSRAADVAVGRKEPPPDWPLTAVDRVHEQLSGLLEARTTARHVVTIAPRRWSLRTAIRAADHQAVHVALLAGSVLQLARAVSPGPAPSPEGGRERVPQPVPTVLVVLAAAIALADTDPAGACAYTASARHHAADLQSGARERTQVVLADVVSACVDDLQRVIDLRHVRAL
ncbi:FUSC family protein [Mycobacterium colombiense]|uniref:FUSC family protein n=1 Tax=Mycobacterium colombiense TaxID=339268 RepID=UPI00200A9B1D|nr:FUSC family protein [Mycobacterium colombiense]MCK8643208.1 FUSC family protein [Mycobacterium colombiense]